MAETESILSSTIFFIVAGIILFIFFLSFLKYKEIEYSASLDSFEYKTDLGKFETLLGMTDKYSREIFSETIVSCLNNGRKYETIYGNVSVENSLRENLDFLYGEGNYYLNIKPRINNLNVLFLYDAGKYIQEIAKKEDFPKIIKETISNFNQSDLNIKFKIYILGTNDESFCDDYSNIDCEVWDVEDLYSSENFTDPVKEVYPNLDENDYQTKFYYDNDWGSFLGRVSEENGNFSGYYSKKELIVLFSDVMSLGGPNDKFFITNPNAFYDTNVEVCVDQYSSCAGVIYKACTDDCINTYTTSSEISSCYEVCYSNYGESSEYDSCVDSYYDCIGDTTNATYGKFYYDYYCPLNENFSLSNFTINRAIKTLVNNSEYVFPIVVRNNNITENSSQRQFMLDYEFATPSIFFGTEANGGNPETICGKDGCPGCFENSTDAIFHKETRANHLAQVNLVSNKTDGKTIIYNSSSNIYSVLNDLIEDILSRDEIIVGTKRNTTKKYIFTKELLKEFEKEIVTFDVYLEVYYDKNYNFNGSLNFKLVINNYYNDSNNFYLILSHNTEINEINIFGNESSLELIETIPNVLYKYNVTFNNYIPTQPFILTYNDSFGVYNLSIS